MTKNLSIALFVAVAGLCCAFKPSNLESNNCTTGILARANPRSGAARYNWRILLSGYAAEYAYMQGLLNTAMSFTELRQKSLIVRPPGATIDANFSQEIRNGLPLAGAPRATAAQP